MNWIPMLGTASLGIAGLLLPLAMNKPRVCIRVADFFKPLCLGATFANSFALIGLVTARSIVLGSIKDNQTALSVGGVAAVDAVRTSLDSGVVFWLGYAVAPMVLFGILVAADRLSHMVLRDAAGSDAAEESSHGEK